MSTCIVGARGFIGSRLLEAHTGKGDAVAVPRNSFLACGISPSTLPASNPLEGCEVAYFLTDATAPSATDDVVVTRNVRTFECFLHCASAAKVKKIILISSGGAVYGEAKYLPVDERHPRRPRSKYGKMMLALESSLQAMSLKKEYVSIALRLSNVYGRTGYIQPNQGVVEHFARCLRAGEPMSVRGSPNNIRDFMYIDDCVSALFVAGERITNSLSLNIGTGVGTSVRQLGHLMAASHGVNPQFLETETDTDDLSSNVLNVEKSLEVLGWRAEVSLPVGVRALLAAST